MFIKKIKNLLILFSKYSDNFLNKNNSISSFVFISFIYWEIFLLLWLNNKLNKNCGSKYSSDGKKLIRQFFILSFLNKKFNTCSNNLLSKELKSKVTSMILSEDKFDNIWKSNINIFFSFNINNILSSKFIGIVILHVLIFSIFDIKYQYIIIISNDALYLIKNCSCFFISSSFVSLTDDIIDNDSLTTSKSSSTFCLFSLNIVFLYVSNTLFLYSLW